MQRPNRLETTHDSHSQSAIPGNCQESIRDKVLCSGSELMNTQLKHTSQWKISLTPIDQQDCLSQRTSDRTSKCTSVRYYISESEEEDPYATDEDKEYSPPVSSATSEQDTPIFSSFACSEFVSPVSSDSSFPQSEKVRKRLDFENDLGSKDLCENVAHSTTVSSLDTTGERSTGCAIEINLKNNWVRMIVKKIVHTGTYELTLTLFEEKLLGFLDPKIPDRYHHCERPKNSSGDYSYAILNRKPNTQKATLKVKYCFLFGKYEGDEITFEEDDLTFITLLKLTSNTTISSDRPIPKKKHCCLFCRKMFVEITAHYYKSHKEEAEIIAIMKMKPASKEKVEALKKLRLQGDDLFNNQVATNQRIPIRNFALTSMDKCVKCPSCLGVLSHKNFARHERRCTGRLPDKQRVLKKARILELPQHNTNPISKIEDIVIKNLIEPLQLGIIRHEVSSDFCLKLLTKKYAFMHRGAPTALKNDRQHLRRLARLLLIIRQQTPAVVDYQDFFVYFDYDHLVRAVCTMCEMNEETGVFHKSALAKSLRSIITQLIDVLEAHYIKNGYQAESIERQGLQRFKTAHNSDFGTYIGRSAHRHTLLEKASKPNVLPTAEDVKIFIKYLDREAKTAFEDLSKEFSYEQWVRLGKAELIKIIVFNRRRVSEVGSILLDLYNKKVDITDEQKSRLTLLERTLANQHKIMTILGKREHILHILLKAEQCKHLDLFISYRRQAGVDNSNKYLFGLPTSSLYINASSAIREFSTKCGARNPHLLRTTYLRKQVATLAQLLTMNDNEIAQVAKLMGHNQKVHENVYRQDQQLFQVTAWAKFLNIVNDEDLNKYRGKSFSEIVNTANEMGEIDDDPLDENHLDFDEVIEDVNEPEDTEEPDDNEEPYVDKLDNNTTNISRELLNETGQGVERSDYNMTEDEPYESNRLYTPDSTPNKKENRKRRLCKQSVSSKKITPVKKRQGIAQILKIVSPTTKRRGCRRFTTEEKKLMSETFSRYLTAKQLAPMKACKDLVRQNRNIFIGRCGGDVYNWVQYQRNRNLSD